MNIFVVVYIRLYNIPTGSGNIGTGTVHISSELIILSAPYLFKHMSRLSGVCPVIQL
jgi:hypothetical protein